MRQAEMVQSGAIDFMLNSTINIAPTIPELTSSAFLHNPSYEAADAVVNSEAGQKLPDKGDYNMVGLGMVRTAWNSPTTFVP